MGSLKIGSKSCLDCEGIKRPNLIIRSMISPMKLICAKNQAEIFISAQRRGFCIAKACSFQGSASYYFLGLGNLFFFFNALTSPKFQLHLCGHFNNNFKNFDCDSGNRFAFSIYKKNILKNYFKKILIYIKMPVLSQHFSPTLPYSFL